MLYETTNEQIELITHFNMCGTDACVHICIYYACVVCMHRISFIKTLFTKYLNETDIKRFISDIHLVIRSNIASFWNVFKNVFVQHGGYQGMIPLSYLDRADLIAIKYRKP